ncbi:hypothetical protein [Methylobrevis pamukkalensis]|uniref:hypothetical protein n=1 Tax=Methylobrevis pamukkalensis TaxID=1439726 RepID=UPI000B145078
MQAYLTALEAGDSQLVLSPTSEFFRYFGSSEASCRGRRRPSLPCLRRLHRPPPPRRSPRRRE